jgi:hypothetical protein
MGDLVMVPPSQLTPTDCPKCRIMKKTAKLQPGLMRRPLTEAEKE